MILLINRFDTFIPLPNYTFIQTVKETLQKLKLGKVERGNIVNFFELLKSFKNLKKLDILSIDVYHNPIELNYKNNIPTIQSYFSNSIHLKQYESIKFRQIEYLNCSEIQKNNPNIRFGWYTPSGKYEGEWENNFMHGIGTLTHENYSDRCNGELIKYSYVGEWKNYREGKGISIDKEGRYVGEWKFNKKHGMGALITYDGVHYEGEWKKGLFDTNNNKS
jgi:hypothetical protein